MKNKIFFFLLFLQLPLFSGDLIFVTLDSEEQLEPAYVSAISANTTEFSSNYIQKLEAVLRFDLGNNGWFSLQKKSAALESLIAADKKAISVHHDRFEKEGFTFVIKPFIEKNTFSLLIYSLTDQKMHTLANIELSGDLNKDRRHLHRAADSLVETLFHAKGIASDRFLFTIKHRINRQKEVAEIFEADIDGANIEQLTQEGVLAVTPIYLPHKKKEGHFLFVSYQTGQPKIFSGKKGFKGSKKILDLPGNQLMPALSPDGQWLAFVSDAAGNPDLFLAPFGQVAKKPRQIYAKHFATQGTPSFSPDGKNITFVSNQDETPRVYAMPIPREGQTLKTIQPTLISKRNTAASAPAWSPDGKKIAYTALIDNTRQIFVYDLDQEKEIQITSGPNHKENPAWAKNSLHLLYNTGTEKVCDIFPINIKQKKPVQITEGSGEKRFPSL